MTSCKSISKLCNFVSSWKLIRTPKIFVQGAFSINLKILIIEVKFWPQVLFNSFITEVPIKQKPVHWFAGFYLIGTSVMKELRCENEISFFSFRRSSPLVILTLSLTKKYDTTAGAFLRILLNFSGCLYPRVSTVQAKKGICQCSYYILHISEDRISSGFTACCILRL